MFDFNDEESAKIIKALPEPPAGPAQVRGRLMPKRPGQPGRPYRMATDALMMASHNVTARSGAKK